MGGKADIDRAVLHVDDKKVESGARHHLDNHRAAGEMHHAHHDFIALKLAPHLIYHHLDPLLPVPRQTNPDRRCPDWFDDVQKVSYPFS